MNIVIIIAAVLVSLGVCAAAVIWVIRTKHSVLSKVMTCTGAVFITTVMCALIYLSIYYTADNTAQQYLQSSGGVSVTHTDSGYFFDGQGESTLLIFYPGAKVETQAYAPLMHRLAAQGIDCFAAEMPFRLALLGKNRADSIMSDYKYEHTYICGHSLGGYVAANYACDNAGKLDGIILLAAYADEKLSDDLRCLSICGSCDEVLNKEKYERSKEFLPDGFTEVVIDGGNHSQFGSYGEQSGDGKAQISPQQQWDKTADAICRFTDAQ